MPGSTRSSSATTTPSAPAERAAGGRRPAATRLRQGLYVPLCAASAFFGGLLAIGGWRALGAARANGWSELGMGWLALDRWTRELPWRPAAALAALAVGLALAAELLAPRFRAGRAGRAPFRLLGHPLVAALFVLASGLPAFLAGAKQPSAPPGSPHVLFVLVDTWRADHAGFLGYERDVSPNLDRLARRGVVFERAIAQSGWTKPSVATLFTGLLPSRHRAVSQPLQGLAVRGINLPPRATTFVEILRARGYDTAMWSDNPNILPVRGFGQGAGRFTDYFSARTADLDPGRCDLMVADVERWLVEERDPARPFCAYVHVMDPHYPYEAPAPFAGRYDRSGLDFQLSGPVVDAYMRGERDVSSITPEMLARLVDAYDEELAFVDAHLGPFLERTLERFPDTVVVLVGDHGEEFLEHGQLGHSHSIYDELVHVPLVLWAPGLEPGRIASQVRLMDVLPTLLELAGFEAALPSGAQGRSLLPVLRGEEEGHRLAPMESGGDQRPAFQWRGISDGRFKLVRREEDLPTVRPVPSLAPWDAGPRPHALLFDLESDPGETQDLQPADPERAATLFELMEERGWYVPPSELLRLAPATAGNQSPDVIERLRELGYAGD